jgi:serine/threonine protein phosphatase PrpC
MVRIHSKTHNRSRYAIPTKGLILWVVVGIIVMQVLVALVYFSTHASTGTKDFGTEREEVSASYHRTGQQKQALEQQHQPERRIENCPDFGCPRYPPELSPQLNQTLLKAFRSNQQQKYDHSTPAGETISPEQALPVSLSSFSSDWFAMLTQQGKSHSENQDRGLFISPFLPSTTTTTTEGNGDNIPSFLVAIFDGHGRNGHLVAQEVIETFPKILALKLKTISTTTRGEWWSSINDGAVKAALSETFVEVNAGGSTPNFYLGGSTASVTLRYGSKLYFANAGDSRTILVSASVSPTQVEIVSTSIEYMTRKDKASLPDEYDRITRLGGTIHINPRNPLDARVIVRSEVAHDVIGLAMSRSLGDWEWKTVGVTAEPIVDIVDLSSNTLGVGGDNKRFFVIAASDGLWDVRRREFYANELARGFDFRYEGSRGGSGVKQQLRLLSKLHEIIQLVTPKAAKGYRDDITAIVAKL